MDQTQNVVQNNELKIKLAQIAGERATGQQAHTGHLR